MSESLIMLLIGAVTIISVIIGYGFRILVDLGVCYFSMTVIMSAINNHPISEMDFLSTCLFAICYTVMWSVDKITKSDKTTAEETDKENWKMD